MNTEVKFHYLRYHPLANGLTESQILELCHLMKVEVRRRSEVIYLDGGKASRIYLSLKGKLKITDDDDSGNELIKEFANEGDLFGNISLDGNLSGEEYAIALTDTTVVASFMADEFKAAMQQNPVLSLNYALSVGCKLRRMEDRHVALMTKDAKSRLIGFIKDWARRDGSQVGTKVVMNNFLTHSDIASFISTSRQSVTIMLNELKDSGLLNYNRRQIELTSFNLN
jgi:CRP/FNR family transcriptional regulator